MALTAIAALLACVLIYSLIMMTVNIIKNRKEPSEKTEGNIKMYLGIAIVFGCLFLLFGFAAFFMIKITYEIMHTM